MDKFSLVFFVMQLDESATLPIIVYMGIVGGNDLIELKIITLSTVWKAKNHSWNMNAVYMAFENFHKHTVFTVIGENSQV